MALFWRRALAAVAAATVFSSISACGSTAPSASPSGRKIINVVGLSDVFAENYQKDVVDPFNASQNDVQVQYKGYPTSAEIISALRTQKASPTADVVIFDYSVAETANAEGLMSKLDSSAVPNLSQLVKGAQNPAGYGPKLTTDNLSLVYNTEGGASAPRAFADLADSKYTGKVAIDGPPDIRGLALITIFAKGDLANTPKAFAQFKQLAPNVETWKPSPEVNQYVIAHPGSVGVGWNARAQMFAKQSGGKLGVVKVPREGSVVQSNTINLVQGSKNAAAAQQFINYALGPDAQAAFSTHLPYGPTNANVQLPAEVRSKAAEQTKNIIPIDWQAVAKQRDVLTSTWQREVQGA